jgi:hypothetical protein
MYNIGNTHIINMKLTKILLAILLLFLLISICSAAENTTDHISSDKEYTTEDIGYTYNKYGNPSDVRYEKVYNTCTIKDRTFKLGGYKVILSKTQYARLYTADDSGRQYYAGDVAINDYQPYTEYYKIPTNKYVKQKIGIGYKGYKLTKLKAFTSKNKAKKYSNKLYNKYIDTEIKKENGKYNVYKFTKSYKKIVTKKAMVYISFWYRYFQDEDYLEHQEYAMQLFTKYEQYYPVVKGKVFLQKDTNSFKKLKTAKTTH